MSYLESIKKSRETRFGEIRARAETSQWDVPYLLSYIEELSRYAEELEHHISPKETTT